MFDAEITARFGEKLRVKAEVYADAGQTVTLTVPKFALLRADRSVQVAETNAQADTGAEETRELWYDLELANAGGATPDLVPSNYYIAQLKCTATGSDGGVRKFVHETRIHLLAG